MPEAQKAPRSVGRALSDIVVVLSFSAIAMAMFLTMADISMRLVGRGVELVTDSRPRLSIFGVVDLMQLFTMVAVSFAIAANFLANCHIRIDLLSDRMGPGLRKVSVVVTALTGTAVIGTCLWTAWNEFQNQLDFVSTSATLGLPFTWYWAPLILGFAISLLCCLWQLVRGVVQPESKPGGALDTEDILKPG